MAITRAKGFITRIIGGENIVPVLIQVAKLAGRIKSKYPGASLGDSIVLATGILTDSDAIITRDAKLQKIEEIEILKPEDVQPQA